MATVRAATGRLRWRMRGAWLWPTFALLTLADAILLTQQPLSGTDTGFVGAFILVGFANTLIIAVLAPGLGWVLRQRDASLPVVVARDRAGVALLWAFVAVLFGLGVLHRGAADAERDAFRAQSAAVRTYVAAHAPAAFRRNVDRADVVQPSPGLYRTCVPGDGAERPLCFFVDTTTTPPRVRPDGDRRTNLEYLGR
jgi:hypothetical protein